MRAYRRPCANCARAAKGFYAWPVAAYLCKRCVDEHEGGLRRENTYATMPGRPSQPHTAFARWRVDNGLSVRALAEIIGCSASTIANIGRGRKAPKLVCRVLRALYPGCPIAANGEQDVYERVLPPGDVQQYPTVLVRGRPIKRYVGAKPPPENTEPPAVS